MKNFRFYAIVIILAFLISPFPDVAANPGIAVTIGNLSPVPVHPEQIAKCVVTIESLSTENENLKIQVYGDSPLVFNWTTQETIIDSMAAKEFGLEVKSNLNGAGNFAFTVSCETWPTYWSYDDAKNLGLIGTSSYASSLSVEIVPIPPIASFTYSPFSPQVNDTITFDASGCSDSDGTIVGYLWDFGDGTKGIEPNSTTTHSYMEEGTYTVTLTVTDNHGLTDSTTTTITDIIIPELSTLIVLPMFVIATTLFLISKKKLKK